MEMIGLKFEIVESNYQEPKHSDHLNDPREFAEMMAASKGKEVFERTGKKSLVLAADTIGVIGDTVLEKPKDKEDAKRMLKLMSGKKHIVITSVALFSPDEDRASVEAVSTEVYFREIKDDELKYYLDNEEYMDKAAAYAIQGMAAVFIEKFNGDYFNVVGLPIFTVFEMLKNKGKIKN